MLAAALCARPKPKIFAAFLSSVCAHGSAQHHHQYGRFVPAPPPAPALAAADELCRPRRLHHSAACLLSASPCVGGAASIWHAILPSSSCAYGRRRRFELLKKGEGSWNAALDARPARWLQRPDSAWLLFGVCACLAPPSTIEYGTDAIPEPSDSIAVSGSEVSLPDENIDSSADYRVTGVLADGRCLFRAIAHVACLRNGDEAPDENRQTELADELRAQVVNELLKRREDSEWFIEGDFDAYVDNIQKPCVWGGEPELLMASHVLKTPIWVFMKDQSAGDLVNIAKYGEEYGEDEENPINVLFHGYGHYDILETALNKIKA